MDLIVDEIKLSISLKDGVLKIHAVDQDLDYNLEITDTKVLRPSATLPYHALKDRLKTIVGKGMTVKKDVILKTLSNILETGNKKLLSVVFSNTASSVFVTLDVEHEGRPVSLILHCNAPPKAEVIRAKIVQIRHKAIENRNNVKFAEFKKSNAYWDQLNDEQTYVKSIDYAQIPDLVI